MFRRPLIPALVSFIAGIFLGRLALPHNHALILPLLFLIAAILIVSLLIPHRVRPHCYLSLFFLVGIFLTFNSKGHSYLADLAKEGKKVVLGGTVISPSRTIQDITGYEIKAQHLFINGNIRSIDEKIMLTVYNNGRDFTPGQRIRFPATLKNFNNLNNPGYYDYEGAMELRGFSCRASLSDGRYIVPMGRDGLSLPLEMIEALRRPVRELIRDTLSPPNQALMRALILGERQDISLEIREPFNIAGIGHVLAVSGLHIGLVACLSFFIFRRLLSISYSLMLKSDIRKIAAVMTCVPVIAYTCIAGFQVSSQRAMIMVIAYLFSILLGREKEIWSTLSLAALIVLAIDPNALFSISFQLSFLAVIGILWLAPAIHGRIAVPSAGFGDKNLFSRIYLYISGLIAVTLSAVIFLMPITAFYFHRISVVSIPANLMAVPALGIWILPLGLLSSVFIHIYPPAARLFMELGARGLDWVMDVTQFFSRFDWASFWTVTPNIFEIALFYCLIFFVFFIRRRLFAKIGLLLVLIIISADISYWVYQTRFNRHLKVTYLDVGQGNSALIQFPGNERMLIDGGGFQTGTFDTGRMVVAPFLFRSKILRIDYLVLSHPHPDHMNGLVFIASNFNPKEFWGNRDRVENPVYDQLIKTIEEKNIKMLYPSDLAMEREIAGVKIELFHPPPVEGEPPGFSDDGVYLNNNSLVLKLSYLGKSFLFPGDIEISGESEVVQKAGKTLQSHILLASHHGSKSSSTELFLKMVKPEICVISCGKGNRFGFPHTEALKRLEDADCKIIRIDRVGAVEITAEENGFKIRAGNSLSHFSF